jgi:DNA-binding response OmpR family regulator
MEKILVIENEKPALENICEILSRKGFKAIDASSGDQGIKRLSEEKPDLILCDLLMPGINGYEVLDTIKKNPDLCGIPFIFLTAWANKENVIKGLELGAQDYITKPFDSKELLIRVKVQLRIKRRANKIQSLAKTLQKEIENLYAIDATEQQQITEA